MTFNKIFKIALALVISQASLAYGETYKCRSSAGHIQYSDSPCPSGNTIESVSEARITTNQRVVPVQESNQGTYAKALDGMVDEAIGSGDLRRAKELAITPAHWSKIRMAETPRPKTSAEIQAEMANSEKCEHAKRSYEIEANSHKQVQESIDAKKRVMYSACGMREPDSTNINNTVNVYR
jgi:hypothetical protein